MSNCGMMIGIVTENADEKDAKERVQVSVIGNGYTSAILMSPTMARYNAQQMLLAADFIEGKFEPEIEAKDKE